MEEENYIIYYKIKPNAIYTILRNDNNGKTFYKITIHQKNYDGTTTSYYRPVVFKKSVELKDKTRIIIKKGIENLKPNPKDKYNPISYITVTDFEIVKNEKMEQQEALDEFRENLDTRNPFYDFGNEINIGENDLPF